jgi:hypothetical protein
VEEIIIFNYYLLLSCYDEEFDGKENEGGEEVNHGREHQSHLLTVSLAARDGGGRH